MATSISWLHFTDLHIGQPEHSRLWPNISEELDLELKKRHDESGPWDLILFTGDLTFSGQEQQFKKLDQWLDALLGKLQLLGSKPIVLAVPGNHDLARQDRNDPRAKALRNWHTAKDIGADFFGFNKYGYLTLVQDAFGEYGKWWLRRSAPYVLQLNLQPGLVPGDFYATFEKAGLRLGIVGLNSAFLQLTEGVAKGGIALDIKQFLALCDYNPSKWAESHHAALLLTHHPPSWMPASGIGSQAEFDSDIYKETRFMAHFCGHLHDPNSTYFGHTGAEPRRTMQGRALSALEPYTNEQGSSTNRHHGFSVCQMQVESGSVQATLRMWPRLLQLDPPMQFIADSRAGKLVSGSQLLVPVTLRGPYVPTAVPPAASQPPTKQPPELTLANMRKYVQALVQFDSVFMNFCHDYFKETWQHFGQGQNYTEKVTLLFAERTAADIFAALHKAFPESAEKHMHLLDVKTRK